MIPDRQNLSDLIENVMTNLITENFNDLTEFLENKIKSEYSYINYDHDEFVKLKDIIFSNYNNEDYNDQGTDRLINAYNLDGRLLSLRNCVAQIDKSIIEEKQNKSNHKRQKVNEVDEWDVDTEFTIANGISSSDKNRIIQVRRSIYIYFNILKKSYKADVPKYVIMYLIDKTTNSMNSRLHYAIRKEKDLLLLVSERKAIANKRQTAVENIDRLQEVKDEIKKLKRDLTSSKTSMVLDELEE